MHEMRRGNARPMAKMASTVWKVIINGFERRAPRSSATITLFAGFHSWWMCSLDVQQPGGEQYKDKCQENRVAMSAVPILLRASRDESLADSLADSLNEGDWATRNTSHNIRT